MRHLRWLLFVAIAMGVTGCDNATKLMAASTLSDRSLELVSGVLSLERVHNQDTAFGLLAGIVPTASRLILLRATATLGTLFVAMVALTRFSRATALERAAFAMLLGGATGNAIDRWRWGYVVDFIRLEHWPTFNVADIALTFGAGLLLLAGWRTTRVEGVPSS